MDTHLRYVYQIGRIVYDFNKCEQMDLKTDVKTLMVKRDPDGYQVQTKRLPKLCKQSLKKVDNSGAE